MTVKPLQKTLTEIARETSFQPLQFKFLPHKASSALSSLLRKADILEPAQVFELFFISEVMDLLVKHTNAYADVKDANSGDKAWEVPGYIWKNILKSKLK